MNKYVKERDGLILFDSTDNGLVRVKPTLEEYKAAKRMAGLLRKLIEGGYNHMGGTYVRRCDSDVFGTCEMREYYRGRKWHTVLRLSTMVGDNKPYDYVEVRVFVILAIQLISREYAALDFSFDKEEAHWVLQSGKRFGSVNPG
jgi:hypothetical protein